VTVQQQIYYLQQQIQQDRSKIINLQSKITELKGTKETFMVKKAASIQKKETFQDSIAQKGQRANFVRDNYTVRIARSYADSMQGLLQGNRYSCTLGNFDQIIYEINNGIKKVADHIKEAEGKINTLESHIATLQSQISILKAGL